MPEQVKLMFLIAIVILMTFVGFIVMVVMVYKKKQLVFQKKNCFRKFNLETEF